MHGAHGDQVTTLLRWLKDGPPGGIPVVLRARPAGHLEAVGWRDAQDPAAHQRFARWQAAAGPFATARFPATPAGGRAWLVEQILEIPDRLLFWVKAEDTAVGHAGLCRFDFGARSAEVVHVVRGVGGVGPGVMTAAVTALCDWASEALRVAELLFRVPAENEPALRLARRCGFREAVRAAVRRVEAGEEVCREVVTLCRLPARAAAA
jgi:RimJ/RimL family protein N-acetyltransferase